MFARTLRLAGAGADTHRATEGCPMSGSEGAAGLDGDRLVIEVKNGAFHLVK